MALIGLPNLRKLAVHFGNECEPIATLPEYLRTSIAAAPLLDMVTLKTDEYEHQATVPELATFLAVAHVLLGALPSRPQFVLDAQVIPGGLLDTLVRARCTKRVYGFAGVDMEKRGRVVYDLWPVLARAEDSRWTVELCLHCISTFVITRVREREGCCA